MMNPKMPVYVLRVPGESIVTQPSAPSEYQRTVKVEGKDWVGARGVALQHAIDEGCRTVAVMVSDVNLYRRPHAYQTLHPSTEHDMHGMWLYLERLCRRFGHVYVPPTAWATRHPSHGAMLSPTIPLVAAYQVKALQSLRTLNAPLGAALCANGYDSFTVGDYFHQCVAHRAGGPVLDEVGSTATWHRAYLNAISKDLI
jgi:hypothetical protein